MGAMILIADDEPEIAAVLADLLAGEGYRVLTARDGREALDTLEREHPALLLTDHQMPRVTGLDLVAHLRAHPDLAVPVILMSAAMPVPSPPPTAFLPKPFDLDALLALVGDLLAARG